MSRNIQPSQPDNKPLTPTKKRRIKHVSIWATLFFLILTLSIGVIRLLPAQSTRAHAYYSACINLEIEASNLYNAVNILHTQTTSDIGNLHSQTGNTAFIAANHLNQYVQDIRNNDSYVSGTYYGIIPAVCADDPVSLARAIIIKADLTAVNNSLSNIQSLLVGNKTLIDTVIQSGTDCSQGCGGVSSPPANDTINYDLCVDRDYGVAARGLPNVNNSVITAQTQYSHHGNPLIVLNPLQPTPEVVYIQRHVHPESAQHIQDAINAGYPAVLTLDRWGPSGDAAAQARCETRRSISTGAYTRNGGVTNPGQDRDEYPFASTLEGGAGNQGGNGNNRIASVRAISASDNRGAGSVIGQQTKYFPNGVQIKIEIIP